MKTTSLHSTRRRNRGTAVLVLLIFITLMMVLCAATNRVVTRSQKEVGLIEKHQLARWATTTNAPAPTASTNVP